ncbi:uncharacterized protein LOC111203903 [Brassica napus]|uniref:uncharacterized protein LOC111203903 n=1 Tax=Brassica napus TaxID=3708 RepID=UPI000BBE0DE4|nr:uncharacterized protein LOC111203903 [Brassica napus]
MAVKTDMSKAYDRIEWDFLREVLTRFGFHSMWVSWIMECVSSVSYTFLINGAPQGGVLPSCGLRQGDPLSPYLFILCTEVLSGLCNQAQDRGTLAGIKVARGYPAINHLLFADDTMFFCRSDRDSCTELMSILNRYEAASGQCINRTKSAITFSFKTLPATKDNVKNALGIANEGGIGKYLGLSDDFGRKKRDIFSMIVDRIRQRAHSWSSKLLSGAGKLVLLKYVLVMIPSYAMSCFNLPQSLCKQIQSVLTWFWWDLKPEIRRLCWVSWEKLTMPKNAGGLGFCDIEHFNDALLAKLAWRLLKHPDSLLGQILLGKYCRQNDLLSCSSSGAMSHGWRGILAGREVIKRGLGWAVGTGKDINVWNENWLSTGEVSRPIGPPNFQDQDLTVQDLILPSTGEWNVSAIRAHLPQYEDTIRLLQPSAFEMQDTLVWLPEKSGSYTTKSGYALAKQHGTCQETEEALHHFNWKTCVWSIATSPKLKLFMWKLSHKALSVGDALVRRGINVNGECKRCGGRESEIHVFFHCPFAAKVWDLLPALQKSLSSTATIPQLLESSKHGAWDASSKKCGMGWTFKDKAGLLLAQGSDARGYVKSVLMAEALALKTAISAAIHLGFLNLRCLSDSSSLISLLTTDSSVTELQGILHDIRVLSSSLLSISFAFTPRASNVCADGLAKSALRLFVNSPPLIE